MKIGTSDYSFRHEFASKTMNWIDDFPARAADIGLCGLEITDTNIERNLPDVDAASVKKFQQDVKSKYDLDILAITGINAGFSWGFGNVWEPFSMDNVKHYIDMHSGITMDWLEVCGEVGIPNLRFDAGGFQASHKVPIYSAIDLNIEIYKRILAPVCERAVELGVKVGIENHGSFTSDMRVLTRLLDEVPGLCVVCDTGNWPFESRLKDIETIASRVNFIHAKSYTFDDDGNEKSIDYNAIVDIMNVAGFDGYWSIEWEGPEAMPDEEGIRKTYNLLKSLE
ncbi:MAG TPA: TIM barrel protein [Candidatus Lokiarchaeia archaeon]|nr:TIM barrel protein [Candidatus Lokiarchaeia archaeon]